MAIGYGNKKSFNIIKLTASSPLLSRSKREENRSGRRKHRQK
jgi:hypothetical protein